jgi:hypothetical protein
VTTTNARQAEKYSRRCQLCLYLLGGLGGIALFASADNALLATRPALGAILLTLGLLAGGVLGLAYSGYQWEQTLMQRRIEDGLEASAPYDRNAHPPNRSYELLYRLGTILVVAAGAWLVLSAWLVVVLDRPTTTPERDHHCVRSASDVGVCPPQRDRPAIPDRRPPR